LPNKNLTAFDGKTVKIYDENNLNIKNTISTIVHESVHVESRGKNLSYSQYEEYRAYRREFLYRENRRPTLAERQATWEFVQKEYDNIPVGENPFGGN
jgi:hypothetical protein